MVIKTYRYKSFNWKSGLGFLTVSAASMAAWVPLVVEMPNMGTPWLMETLWR